MKTKNQKKPASGTKALSAMGENKVRPKKHLGQHFLNDEGIAQEIADTLTLKGYETVLEIGPGMGMLTKYLLQKPVSTFVIEIDRDSVAYLESNYPQLEGKIISEDFLKYKVENIFKNGQFAIIGNFPYNISTQIVFRMLEYRSQVPEFSGMFQKEVAERICEKKGSKVYDILSVLVQAFYEAEYLFTVNETVFTPPPKVKSGVLRLTRKENYHLPCDEHLFFIVVKTAFNQRRKTLRNSLKSIYSPLEDHLGHEGQEAENKKQKPMADYASLGIGDEGVYNFNEKRQKPLGKNKANTPEKNVLDLRPEQIDVVGFIALTNKIKTDGLQNK